MIRWLLLLLLLATPLSAQTREVFPGQLSLSVSVEEATAPPLVGEMVLITIRGTYRRHITRETLRQPDLAGFNWSQLGRDQWTEERIGGQQVKTFTRRMALYPTEAGTLTIGAFAQDLTLTDEGDDWFAHQITSEPVSIEVAPAPPTEDWWFPVRRLQISDQWSNAPDQLAPGEGVLRMIRLEALGVTPEMIPPMPELTSPSAMIFAHPEKRLVELTPEGPVTYAFWRWTIRPTNDVSTIVEPLGFTYFDTFNRVHRSVTISPQRVAYGVADSPGGNPPSVPAESVALPGWPVLLLSGLVFLGGVAGGLRGRRVAAPEALRRLRMLDPLARAMTRAARSGNGKRVRHLASRMLRRDGARGPQPALLAELDCALFDPRQPGMDLSAFVRRFLSG